MAENLRTITYNDGTPITNVTSGSTWAALGTGAYCWYNNDEATNKNTYGAMYNWYAVSTAKLCPLGWHVPTDTEWTALTTYFGGESIAGGLLKETGTTHWISNSTTDNSRGFTALPGGHRYDGGLFVHRGYYGWWWSTTVNLDLTWSAWTRLLANTNKIATRQEQSKSYGISVRCLRD